MCVCVCACERAYVCVRACVRVCACVRVRGLFGGLGGGGGPVLTSLWGFSSSFFLFFF